MREHDEREAQDAIEAAVLWQSQVEFMRSQADRSKARKP